MRIFNNLSATRFFEEVEKYFGFYKEELHRPVFVFISNLNDFERAAMYNLLVEKLPAGRGAPDISCFCKFLKEAKTEGALIMRSLRNNNYRESPEEKKQKKEELNQWLKNQASCLQIDAGDTRLLSKIFMYSIKQKKKER